MLARRMQLWRSANAAATLTATTHRPTKQSLATSRTNRHMHVATGAWNWNNQVQLQRSTPLLRASYTVLPLNAATVRFASTDDGADGELNAEVPESLPTKELVDLPNIPDAPTPPPFVDPLSSQVEVVENLNAAGEATFASIGLGGWTPVGLVQNCMEFLHCTWELPWWGAIAIGTLVVRTIIFPLVIVAQRNSAKMNNNMPQMQLLQLKMTEARQSGNALESARYAQEMMLFMREKGVNPLKNMVVPLAQAPLFISFFMGLRQMANTPVASMREGGLWWFTDLTVADPLFLLPLITSATLYLTIEIGTDSARLSAANMQTMKYVLRALPIVIFPFTMNFPAAILTYWACSNFISLGQVAVLRIPTVRDYFKIEKMLVHQPSALPAKKKGFVGGMKESWDNMKITKEIEERQRLDEIRFAKAGKGPLVKTFKHDPTKPQVTASLKDQNQDQSKK
ncbi:mitochondrial inner membrane protein OXA1L [Scaptodrosophila lebanonensis]|uniref:Mitochondrial inner membrane protein OXA1L n=1 Tax=Drosophila lebanonensis TaxID=7225 RepID=A0A6J2UCR6_DROLE|nr:mitochondrial inner membrane protein OXA1L [Scaptodrosophila lebanonensis]